MADAGYGNGENYHFSEDNKLASSIPKHGAFMGGPEGFTIVIDQNYWL